MIVKKDIDAKMAEEMLLGSLLYKPDKIIHIIDEINPANFSVPTFGQIYNCILELYKDDVEPDDVMVINKAISLGYDIATGHPRPRESFPTSISSPFFWTASIMLRAMTVGIPVSRIWRVRKRFLSRLVASTMLMMASGFSFIR